MRNWRGANLYPALIDVLRDMTLASAHACGPAALVTAVHAITFPILADALCDPGFPFRLAGSVHTKSSVSLFASSFAKAGSAHPNCILLSDSWRNAEVEAVMDLSAGLRPHKRGFEVDATVSVLAPAAAGAGALLWSSTATFLFMTGQKPVPGSPPTGDPTGAQPCATAPRTSGMGGMAPPPTVPEADELAASLVGEASEESGRGAARAPLAPATPLVLPEGMAGTWSSATGDFNPIHMSAAGAWIFGFAGRVAYGMGALHTAIPRIVRRADAEGVDAEVGLSDGSEPLAAYAPLVQLSVTFVRPLILPTKPVLFVGDAPVVAAAADAELVGDTRVVSFVLVQGRGSPRAPAPLKPCIAGYARFSRAVALAELDLKGPPC